MFSGVSEKIDIDEEKKKIFAGLRMISNKGSQLFMTQKQLEELYNCFKMDIIEIQNIIERKLSEMLKEINGEIIIYLLDNLDNDHKGQINKYKKLSWEFAKYEPPNWVSNISVINTEWELRRIIDGCIDIIQKNVRNYQSDVENVIAEYIESILCFSEDSHKPNKIRDENEINLFLLSDIICENPVLNRNSDMRRLYFAYLDKYLRLGGWQKNFIKAQRAVYWRLLNQDTEETENQSRANLYQYRYYLLLDLLYIVGFDHAILVSERMASVIKEFSLDFSLSDTELDIVDLILKSVDGKEENWEQLKCHPILRESADYLTLTEKNIKFAKRKERRILITGNMSAGKSTLINALVGKRVVKSSQEVCTANVAYIYGKPIGDRYIYKEISWKYLDAENRDEMQENGITSLGVAFRCFTPLKKGICLIDTPGVNCTLNKEHREIAQEALLNETYEKAIYVLNGNKLGTDEEIDHLKWISQNIPKEKVIFVLNKLDSFGKEDNIQESLQKVENDLRQLGFVQPRICPCSAYFAFLLKRKYYGDSLTEDEEDEYSLYSKKFKRHIYDLSSYYNYNCKEEKEDFISMSKRCGLYGLENILYGGCI